MPYAKDNISWPELSSHPVRLLDVLSSADRERLVAWRLHMLRPDGNPALEGKQATPYTDPILKHNSVQYGGFLRELGERNMIGYRKVSEYDSMLGIFFVKKKSSQLRLIFDTRRLNVKFTEPPSTDLPSADAFTRLDLPENVPFYIASGDLANAFYTLAVPDKLAHLFTLPTVEARHAGHQC